jgi:hypothetical protein
MAPQVVHNHPNATLAALTIPCSMIATWVITNRLHQALSTEDGSAIGGGLAAAALTCGRFIKIAAVFLGWAIAEYGLFGCCKRVLHGRQKP